MDVLAAQVRERLTVGEGVAGFTQASKDKALAEYRQATAALAALVARAKEAEERAEAHLLLRKEAASWAEEVEAERDALVARVTEAEEREAYAWSCAEDMKGWAQRAEQKLATARQNASLSMGREVGWQHRAESAEAGLADARNALERIVLFADVMIGNGPGAVDAYYRHPNRVAAGLPTQFSQLRDHAKEIRAIVQGVLAPDTEPIDGEVLARLDGNQP